LDYPRAKQIFESPQVIKVKYRGKPVWIESLDREGHTARVTIEKDIVTVPIGELME
jgi:H-type small acid-soluble spore protein